MKSLLNLCLLFLFIWNANGQVYVKKTASGLNNGTSWTNAYTNLQTAISNAPTGSSIYVAADTFYLPAGNRDNTFAITNKSLTIYGGFPNTGNPTLANRAHRIYHTILSGDVNMNDAAFTSATRKGDADRSDNVKNVVRITCNNANYNIVLDGLVIQSGNYFEAGGYGSGVYISKSANGGASATITIKNCVFRYLTGQKNAAIGTYQYFSNNGTLMLNIESNHFYDNTSDEFPIFYTNIAGPAGLTFNTLVFQSNVVRTNTATSAGTGLLAAICNDNSNASSYFSFKLNFNTFVNNTLNSNSGVICAEGTNPTGGSGNVSSVEISNNIFKNNSGAFSAFKRNGGKNFYYPVLYDYNLLPATDSFQVWYGGINNRIGTVNFVSEALHNYRLADCSPIINSGGTDLKSKDGTLTQSILLPSKDAEDNARLMGGTVDRGALEYFGSILPNYITVNKTICAKDSFFFNGAHRKAPGTFKDTLTNMAACDSFITLNLMASVANTNFNKTICPGSSFTFGGKTLNTAGTYYDTLQSYLGCDSIVTCSLSLHSLPSLTIGVFPPNNSVLVASMGFDGYGWFRNDTMMTSGTSNTYNFGNVKGVYKCAAIKTVPSAVCTTYSNLYSYGMVHSIVANAGPNGSISPSGTITRNSNDTITFFITPNAGFKLDSLLINGMPVTPVSPYFVSSVSSDFTIRAVFKAISTSLKNSQTESWIVYPNPASDYITIEGIESGKATVGIQNLNGVTLPLPIDNNTVQIGQLPNGVYFMTIEQQENRKSFKIIKQ